jgi:hypothetical protein
VPCGEPRSGKDFWDRAIILTSKDANLTKAHYRYLESRFITLAVQAKRSRLVNGTALALLPLPEADGPVVEQKTELQVSLLYVSGIARHPGRSWRGS